MAADNVAAASADMIPEMYLNYMKQLLIPHLVADKCFDRYFVNFDFFDGKFIN